MAEGQNVAVAVENSEVSTDVKEAKAPSDAGATKKPLAPSQDIDIVKAVVTGKRQLTLLEMAKPKQPALRKQKLAESTSPAGVNEKASTPTAAKLASTSLQPLNFIPFSLQGFKDSLSEEERNLLALECETMGMSWWVVDSYQYYFC